MKEVEKTRPPEGPSETGENAAKKVPRKSKSREELEKTKNELSQKHDQLLRLAAEFENHRKRTSRDFANLIKTANEDLIRQLLPVLDNLERALDHSKTGDNSHSLREGVVMILGQLLEILEKQGLKPLEAVGKSFDPYLHEAVMQAEDDEYPSGTVVNEIEKGYLLNEKVLRHTKVAVNK